MKYHYRERCGWGARPDAGRPSVVKSVSRKADLPDARPSGKIAGYRLDRCIGQSDTAAVYLATDEHLDRQVALKVLAPELAAEPAFRSRLLRESRAAAALGHPHIVPVYEANDAAGILYVAMRYIPGGDSRSLLNRIGPLPLAATGNIISQAASALDAAHTRGLIHRDVKPTNILLDADHVYICDFGMGTDTSANEPRTAGQLAGMFDYAAPEQVEGLPLDGRADLYSLACAAFELLCGTPLFEQDHGLTVMYAQLYVPAPSASTRRHELPPAVDGVLATALAKDPADRYATCGQFAAELAEALGLSSRPATPRPSPSDRGAPGQEPAAVSGTPSATQSPLGQSPPGQSRSGQSRSSQPPPGQPGGEAASGTDGPEPARGWRQPGVVKLILAVVAVAIIAVVVIIVVAAKKPAPHAAASSRPTATSSASSAKPSPTPSPSAAPQPSAQAAAVAHLLDSSAATRQALHGAVDDVATCTSVSSAASQIQNAVNQRSTEYSQASALSVSALANGAVVKSDLVAALRTSLAADKDYLTWAQQQLTLGCTSPGQSSAYSVAFNADQTANAAKAAFVAEWNPVAAKYGDPQKSADSI
jgi:serine/threonine protein kinase